MNAPTEKLVADMKAVAGDMRELIALTADQSADTIVSARRKAKAALAAMEERLAHARTAAIEGTHQAVTQADDYVHESPWAAIAGAALAAFLVGFLAGRR